MNNISLYIFLPIHLSVDRQVGWLHLSAIVNEAARGMGALIALWIPLLFVAYAHVKLLEHIVMFKFLWDSYTIFRSSCTILHSHQQCTRLKISTYLYQLVIFCFCFFVVLCFVLFLIRAILNSTEWHFTVVLI